MKTETEKKSELQIVVDAAQLFEKEITQENQEELINKYVELIDPNGTGSPFGAPNKDQETVIYEGSEMTWSITTLKPDEKDIDGVGNYLSFLESMVQEVNPEESKGFFKEGLKIDVNGKNQIVGHVLTDDSVKDGDHERYILRFHITKGDLFKDSMTIDPKLLIKKKPNI
ncbi:hypothetical protein [Psychroserpens sp.]|uniref:hypothetical protein n=1 Tax=Psychroserpens sp. TaxID=2020870 RepID=UPI002B2652A3|nr:hypothetical protein [Psychroserpens sp.]